MSNPKKTGKKEKTASAGKKGEGGGGEDSKRDQKLQAILLADSFQKAFRPVTWETPKVLLPLVNVPMLEYTIEFLAQNGVEEVFDKLLVNCCSLLFTFMMSEADWFCRHLKGCGTRLFCDLISCTSPYLHLSFFISFSYSVSGMQKCCKITY